MSSQTLDHHVGKPVTNVVPGDDHSTIIFEDESIINVPGAISADVVGQILLLVEGDNPPTLVFGYPQAEDSTFVRTAEIPVPIDPVTMELPEKGGVKMSATEEPKPNGEEEPAAEPGAEPAEEPAADDAAGGDEEPSKDDDAAS